MGGYPDFLILIGAYIRWFFSGFKKEKLERYLDDDNDKINFIISLAFIIGFLWILIFLKKVVFGIY